MENDAEEPGKRGRGRPRGTHKPTIVAITATPKRAAYLDALIEEEGYGNSRAGVALNLCWRMVEQLTAGGTIERIPGTYTGKAPNEGDVPERSNAEEPEP